MKYTFKSRLFTVNIILLTAIFIYLYFKLWLSDSTEEILWSGGAALITTAAMSSFLIGSPPIRQSHRHPFVQLKMIPYSLLFGMGFMIISDLMTMIFERFLRLPEHYVFTELLSSWPTQWYRIAEGTLICWFYLFLIRSELIEKHFRMQDRSVQKIKRQLHELELQALRSQLNPHFLYNAMNSIAMMIRTRRYDESVEMTANLNDLLRVSLDRSGEQLITLREELDLLDKYVSIEMIRFGEQVAVRYDIDRSLLAATVPQLLLQPIVENAFKHGISQLTGNQTVKIAVSSEEEQLIFTIINETADQVRISFSNSREGKKVGISNLKERLRKLYGGLFKIQVTNLDGALEFRIVIPLQL